MSLKKNTIANYIGQVYTILAGLIAMPLFLKLLEPEAFGLVGFYTLLLTWLSIFDLGFSASLGRQVAYERGQDNGLKDLLPTIRIFEFIFLFILLLILSFISTSGNWIAITWLKSQYISNSELTNCIYIMGGIASIKIFAGLYKSGLYGFEKHILTNKIIIFTISLKYFGALAFLYFFTNNIINYFTYQIVITLIEFLLYSIFFYKNLPKQNNKAQYSYEKAKKPIKFALSLGYTSTLWVIISQVDKLILSNILTLENYGYFSFVAIVTTGIMQLASPIAKSILPRMTLLYSTKRLEDMIRVYRKSSQVTVAVITTLSIFISTFSYEILFVWTNDLIASEWAEAPLFWYSIGSGILALSAYQFYLQNVFGDLKLHIIGSTISAIIQIPIIYYSALNFGAIGAAVSWFAIRLVWFFIWTPIVHNRLLPNFHLQWLFKDILPIVTSSILSAIFLSKSISFDLLSESHLIVIFKLSFSLTLILLTSFLSSSFIRIKLRNLLLIFFDKK